MVARALALVSLAIAVASSGCKDFATPAELDRPQIVAIASDPASVRPGERALLSLLVAGPDGPVTPDAVGWRVTTQPGIPALGRVETVGADTFYVAPDQADEDPTGTLVEVTVSVGEVELVGLKAMVVTRLALENPAVTAIERDGAAIEGSLQVARGDRVELGVALDPEATEDLEVAWYSTSLAIEKYRSQPTEAEVPEAAEDGWLIAVARDRGGIGWLAIPVEIGE